MKQREFALTQDFWTYRPQTPFSSSHGPCNASDQIKDLWDTDKPATAVADGTYEEEILFGRASQIIEGHPPSAPLFIYYAFHIVHCPLEVPNDWLHKYEFIGDSVVRQKYHAMVGYMDEVVGNVTSQIRGKGMWDRTLIVQSSDNGGPIYKGAGANNHPLKGGKVSDWEGGVRVNAWVAGGILPESARGTKVDGYMHISVSTRRATAACHFLPSV